MRILAPILALATAALAPGCGDGPNRLWGSIKEVYPLDFDTVHVQKVDTYLVVEYLKDSGKVVKLSANLAGIDVQPDAPIDLTEMVGVVPRGTLQRIVGSTITFTLDNARLTLDAAPEPGATLSGGFRALLSDPEGRTLNGDFEGEVTAP